MAKLMVCVTLAMPTHVVMLDPPLPDTPVTISQSSVWPPPPWPARTPPPTWVAFELGPPAGPPADNHSYVKSRRGQGLTSLERIKACESGGDYGAVSRSGKFSGAYQFDQNTFDGVAPDGWAGVAPHEAPPEVQDQAAANLQAARGNAPWPVCGR